MCRIEEPQVKLRNDHLTARSKRLANENKLEALKNLLEASKSISTFDVGPVYMAMLQLYGRRGDCDGALSLWTSIQDADVQPSSEFLNILAALLRSHKREIPFVVTNGEEKSLPVHSKSKIPKQITKTSGDAKERTFSQ
ncbi:leucine-rich PPR motif-containing protein, mitochondrial-like [Periplaneta americana]|uniref:leucine-rich PPR motif-containing protein, mitochondrial-like n=1 Tax=Periplaneta americana TaxID=6978 RepID=UPI0037E7D58E